MNVKNIATNWQLPLLCGIIKIMEKIKLLEPEDIVIHRNLYTATESLMEILEDILVNEEKVANEENPIGIKARYLRYLRIVKKDASVLECLIACYRPRNTVFISRETKKNDNEKAIKKEQKLHDDYMSDIYTLLEDATIEEVKEYRDDEDEAIFRKYSKHALELFGPDDVYEYIISVKKKEDGGKNGQH